jgi:hypothetical protein
VRSVDVSAGTHAFTDSFSFNELVLGFSQETPPNHIEARVELPHPPPPWVGRAGRVWTECTGRWKRLGGRGCRHQKGGGAENHGLTHPHTFWLTKVTALEMYVNYPSHPSAPFCDWVRQTHARGRFWDGVEGIPPGKERMVVDALITGGELIRLNPPCTLTWRMGALPSRACVRGGVRTPASPSHPLVDRVEACACTPTIHQSVPSTIWHDIESQIIPCGAPRS